MVNLKAVSIPTITVLLIAFAGCRSDDQPSDVNVPQTANITPKTPPQQVARVFLQTLESFLNLKRSNSRQAEQTIKAAAKLIADQTVQSAVEDMRLERRKITAEQALRVKKAYASAWAAVINFYCGHIAYPKLTSAPAPLATQPRVVRVVFPAHKPGPTKPTNIVVACIKEDTWKVQSLRLTPRPTTQPQIGK